VVDPLTEPLQWTDTELAGDVATWVAGIDQDGQPVTIKAADVSGIVVAGLAGYGKTVFLNARFCALAASEAVQFVLIDGKGGPDYDDLFTRAWLSAKDEPEEVRDHLVAVHGLMKARQDTIRTVLGVRNVWHVGPSPSWPLVLLVMDEAHTFLNESKGTDPESKRLDGIVRQTVRLVEELVRKGRNVGIQVVLATQKPTGDAIPTRIRDNCQVSLSFAQRTSEAAVAVLGADISEHPDEHPRRLVDPAYVGVASMVAQGRPGFTLVRTPYVPDHVADAIARRGAHLVRDPIELQTQMCTPPRTGHTAGSSGGRAAAHSAKNQPPLSATPAPTYRKEPAVTMMTPDPDEDIGATPNGASDEVLGALRRLDEHQTTARRLGPCAHPLRRAHHDVNRPRFLGDSETCEGRESCRHRGSIQTSCVSGLCGWCCRFSVSRGVARGRSLVSPRSWGSIGRPCVTGSARPRWIRERGRERPVRMRGVSPSWSGRSASCAALTRSSRRRVLFSRRSSTPDCPGSRVHRQVPRAVWWS